MVKQIPSSEVSQEALKGSCSYFTWLCQCSGLEGGPLARLFYETDFRWPDTVPDDENRAKNAKDLREQYAIYLLAGDHASDVISEAQWRDIDRMKKSIIGDACVFEVLVHLAIEMDNLMNMNSESQIKQYFAKLMENAGFDLYDEEDWDGAPDKVDAYWKQVLDRVLDRTYLPDGEGSLFPLDVTSEKVASGEIDQRTRPLWEQLNDWVDQEMEIDDGLWDDGERT